MHPRSSHDPTTPISPAHASILHLPNGGLLKEMDVEERRRKKTCGAVTRNGGICKNPIITTFGICPVHVSQARGYRAKGQSKSRRKQTKRHASKTHISTAPLTNFFKPSPRITRNVRATRAIPDATFNSLSLPTSPLTDEEIEAETFWDTPQLKLDADVPQVGEAADLSRILIFNEP